jgi:hypothetical protein
MCITDITNDISNLDYWRRLSFGLVWLVAYD